MFLFSNLQVRTAVFCSVPDGDEHSFPWIRGCHKACFATWETKVFCLAICGEGCGFLDAKAHVCGLCICGVAHA